MKRWFDRTFPVGLPVANAPALLVRLGRTPDRIAASLHRLQPPLRIYKPDGRWSIQEHAGHLLDLEPLWDRRLDDFDRGAPILEAADLQNRRTHEARHNDRDPRDLEQAFRTARMGILARLTAMGPSELARVSRHPRLDQSMSVVDLCSFVAERDDHHLAAMDEIAAAVAEWPACAVALANAVDGALPWLTSIAGERTARRPAAGKWSAREIVGHLIDSASNNHQRFVRARWQDDLIFNGYDQEAWVDAQGYQQAPWPELLALWAGYNRHLARVMASVPGAVRTAPHTRHNFDRLAYRPVPAGEPSTLEYFMDDYVRHMEHHLRQIRALVSRDA